MVPASRMTYTSTLRTRTWKTPAWQGSWTGGRLVPWHHRRPFGLRSRHQSRRQAGLRCGSGPPHCFPLATLGSGRSPTTSLRVSQPGPGESGREIGLAPQRLRYRHQNRGLSSRSEVKLLYEYVVYCDCRLGSWTFDSPNIRGIKLQNGISRSQGNAVMSWPPGLDPHGTSDASSTAACSCEIRAEYIRTVVPEKGPLR